MKKLLFSCSISLGIAFLTVGQAPAQDAYYIGGQGNNLLTNGANWVGGTAAGDWQRLNFGSAVVSGTLDLNNYNGRSGITVTSGLTQDMTIANDQPLIMNSVLAPGNIDMSAATKNLTVNTPTFFWGDSEWNVGSGATLFMNGGIYTNAGSAVITKTGAGNAWLTNQNDLRYGVNVNGGTLVALRGALGSGPLVINNGGTLYVNDQWVFSGSNGYNVSYPNPSSATVNAGGQIVFDPTNGFANTISNLYLNGGSVTGGPDATSPYAAYGAMALYNGNEQITASGSTTSAISANIGVNGNNNTITVDGGSTLNISGVLRDGAFGGAGGIIKAGAGTLSLSAANTYSGVTTFAGGVVNAATITNYGVAGSLGNRAADTGGEDMGLLFRGGTLQYTGTTAQSTDRAIRVSTSGAIIDASGSGAAATLSFTAASSPNFFEAPGSRTVTFAGSNTGANTFATAIGEAGGPTSVVKSGPGRWVLSGASSYSGGTTITGGTLSIGSSNALGASTGSLAINGGTLDLAGFTVGAGAVTVGTTSSDPSATPIAGLGTLAAASFVVQGNANNGPGAGGGSPVTISSGTLTTTGNVGVGRWALTLGGSSTVTVSGTIGGGGIASSADWGTLNIQDNAVVTATGGVNGNAEAWQLNLNGGTLFTPSIQASDREPPGGEARLVFNGTKVVATASNPTFVTVGANAFSTNSAVVGNGGVAIDSAGFDLGIAVNLQAGAGSSGGLTKLGAGTLALTGTSSYAGVTTFGGGVVNAATFANNGTASSLGVGTGDTNPESIGLLFRGGVLQYTGSTAQSTDRAIRLGLDGGTIDASGVTPGATLSFTRSSMPNWWENAGTRTFTLKGSNTGANTIAAGINDIPGLTAMNVRKEGAGTWVLSGSGSYLGTTDITAGTLVAANNNALGVGGFSAATKTTVRDGATLALQGGVTIDEHIHFAGTGVGGGGAIRSLSGNNSLTSQGYALDANATIGVDADTLTMSNIYQDGGTYGITKVGAGTLSLNTASSYSGGTTINGGTVLSGVDATPGGNSALGTSTPSNVVTINNGGVVTGGSVNNWLDNTALASGGGNAHSVVINSGGVLRGSVGYLTGLGNTTLNGGTIEVTNGVVDGNWNGSFTLGGDITVSGSLASAITTAPGSGASANLQMSNGGNAVGGTRTFTVNDVTGNAASDLVVSARLAYGTVVKAGAGTLELAAGAAGTGGAVNWQLDAGTLKTTADNVIAGGVVTSTSDSTTFDLGGSTQAVGGLGAAGAGNGYRGTIANGTVNLNGNNAYLQSGTFTMNLTGGGNSRLWIGGDASATVSLGGVNSSTFADNNSTIIGYPVTGAAGTVKLLSAGALGPSGQNTQVHNGSTLDLNGQSGVTVSAIELYTNGNLVNSSTTAVSYSGGVALSGQTASEIGGPGNITLSGELSRSGGFTKVGAGVLNLTGASSYTGPTTVSAGKLAVNGSLGNTAITVASGATLGGSGSIAGTVNVLGTLSPGNSPGVITLGSVTLGGSSTTLIEINGTGRGVTYDGVNVTSSGGLTYGGLLSFNFGSLSPDSVTYHIFDFTGGFSGAFTTVSSTGAYAGTWTDIGGGQFQLLSGAQTLTFTQSTGDVVVVPEPAAIAFVGVGTLLAGLVVRRRRKSA